jgi:transposase
MLWQRGKAYPPELRERVFMLADAGLTVGTIARTLLVSVSYVSKVLSRREKTGETTARAQRCHLVPRLHDHAIRIQERVQAKPDSTLTELCAWLRQEHQMEASVALMAKTLSQLGLTLKKRRSMQLNRTGRMWPRNALPGGTDRPHSTRPN